MIYKPSKVNLAAEAESHVSGVFITVNDAFTDLFDSPELADANSGSITNHFESVVSVTPQLLVPEVANQSKTYDKSHL